jgi:hypothetical protein
VHPPLVWVFVLHGDQDRLGDESVTREMGIWGQPLEGDADASWPPGRGGV